MNEDLIERQRHPLLIVISGPSGVGKDTVVQRMKALALPFHFVITATTRPIRSDEVDGVDYFFVSPDEFNEMIKQDELLEHAVVYNQYKGIPKQQVREALNSGDDVLMRLDVQGAETIRELCPDALLIFLATRNEQELIDRLKSRRTETPEDLELRIATARQEMKRVEMFDYYIVNADGELDVTVETIQAIIKAEHYRTDPRQVTL
jgi:guanylate kinase